MSKGRFEIIVNGESILLASNMGQMPLFFEINIAKDNAKLVVSDSSYSICCKQELFNLP